MAGDEDRISGMALTNSETALDILLPAYAMYLCEAEFPELVIITAKCHSTPKDTEAALRLPASNAQSKFTSLCKNKTSIHLTSMKICFPL